MTGSERSARNGPGVAVGAAAALGGQFALYGLGLLASVLIARAVGAEGRGEYFIVVTAASACLTLAGLGLEAANAVFVGRREYSLDQLSRNASALALLMAPVVVLAMSTLFAILQSSAFQGVRFENYAIALATTPFSLHLLWLSGIFLLAKQLPRSQAALVAGGVMQLGGVIILYLWDHLGVTEVLGLYAGSVLLPWMLHVRWSRPVASIRPRLDLKLMRRLTGFGVKFHIGMVLTYLLLRSDVFLVNAYLGSSAVGVYSLAVLFAELAWLLTNPLVQAVVPFQAEVSVKGSAPLAFKASRFNLALALLLSVVFAATLSHAIPFVYGSEFSDAYAAVLSLLPGVIAMSVARPLGLFLTRQERPLLYTAITLAMFLLNCGLNVVLIPAIGIVGAGVASSIAYTMLASAYVYWALRAADISLRDALAPRHADVNTVRKALSGLVERFART